MRRLGELSSPNVDLQRLVKQSWSSQRLVALLAHGNKLFLGSARLEMLVLALVACNSHPCHWALSLRRGVVMPCPDPNLVGQIEKFLSRAEEVTCASTGEITARAANVRVEDGIATEDVISNLVAKMVGRVAWEMHGARLKIANGKNFVVFKELDEDIFVLLLGHAVLAAKEILYLANALSNPDGRLSALVLGQTLLQVGCSGDVIRVGMSFQDHFHLIVLFVNQSEQGISSVRPDGLRDWIIVQHGVNDDGFGSSRVGDNVLPSARYVLKHIVNDWLGFGGHFGCSVGGGLLSGA